MSEQEPQVPDDEEEIDEEEEELPGAPEPKPEPTIASPPRARSPGRGGARVARWNTRDAEDLWPEILGRLPGLKKSPSDIDVRISRIDPAPKTYLQTIRGNIISGSTLESPRDALVKAVDRIHMTSSPNQGPARYELNFVWRVGSKIYGRGEIDRPSVAEIMGLRPGPPPGMGASPGYYPYYEPPPPSPPQPQAPPPQAPQPTYPYPPQGFGYPPPAPPSQGPDFKDKIIHQLMEHMIARGVQPPPTLAAPPQGNDQPPVWAQALIAKVDILQAQVQGTPSPAGRGLGAAPLTLSREGLAARREQLDLMREMRTLNDEMNAFFSPTTQEALGAAPGEPEAGEAPEDDLPYQIVEIAGADPNAILQRFARDKKTGNIDFQYTALNNPKLAEKALEIAGKLTDTFGKFFKEAQPGTRPAGIGEAPPPPALNGSGSWSDS